MADEPSLPRCQERMFAFSRRCPRPANGPIPGYCDLHSQCRVRGCERTRIPASGDRLCTVHRRRHTIRRRAIITAIVVLVPWGLYVAARITAFDRNPCAIGATSYGIFGPQCAVTTGELNAADRVARRAVYQDFSSAFDDALSDGLATCQEQASAAGFPGDDPYQEVFDTCWANTRQLLHDLTDAYNADVEAAGLAARSALYTERTGKPFPFG